MSTTTTILPPVSQYATANEAVRRARVGGVYTLSCDWHPIADAPNASTSIRNARGALVGICSDCRARVMTFVDEFGTLMSGHRYPLVVLSSNSPGCLPDDDSPLVVHTGTRELDDYAIEAFVDSIATGLVEWRDALIEDRDTRTDDKNVHAFALSSSELDDEISGYDARVESVQSTAFSSIGQQLRDGVRHALRVGTEYGYTVSGPDGEQTRNYFVAPVADEWPVCSEFEGDEFEYASCEHGCTPRP